MDARPILKDDPTIPDCDLLYRRIIWPYVKEGNEVASGAYINRKKSDPDVSVDLSSLSTPQETLARWPLAAGVAQVVTGMVRTLTTGVARDPIEGNPAHALIIRDPNLSNHQWKEVARKLAKASVWAIAPR
jgi:hypothetical protein